MRRMIMALQPPPSSMTNHIILSLCLFPFIFFMHGKLSQEEFCSLLLRRTLCPSEVTQNIHSRFPLPIRLGLLPLPATLSPLSLTLPCTISNNCCYNSPPSPTKIYLIGRERGNGEIAGFILIVSTLSSAL